MRGRKKGKLCQKTVFVNPLQEFLTKTGIFSILPRVVPNPTQVEKRPVAPPRTPGPYGPPPQIKGETL